MKFKVIFIYLFLPFILNSQNENKFYFGFNFSPDLCGRTLRNSGNSESVDLLIDIRNNSEISKLGYTAGLSIVYDLNRKFKLETGFLYSSKGFQTPVKEVFFGDQIRPDTILDIKGHSLQIKYIYQFIEIPIMLNYFIEIDESLNSFVGLGYNNQILINAFSKFILDDKVNNDYYLLNSTNKYIPGVNLLLGLEKQIKNNLHVRVNFCAKNSFKSLYNYDLKTYLWSYGINAGIYLPL